VRNGSATPREEGFAKQTHVILLGGWYAEDVSQEPDSGCWSQEPWLTRYGGYTLRSVIEAPLITREVLPETYFLLVIVAADAQARPFLQFQASC
jgi:hypothetical protein